MAELPVHPTEAFRDALKTSKHILVIAGAGLSAASGIPTFRDGGGMWRSLDATSLATPEAFKENPSLVWQFYHYRRLKALGATPNAAHDVIAKMSMPAHLRKVAPDAKTFHLVTQNVDRLSPLALQNLIAQESTAGGSDAGDAAKRPAVFKNSIFEMHGKIYDVRCTQCNFCGEDRRESLCSALDSAAAQLDDYHDAGSKQSDIAVEDLPHCPQCGALARPGVVWFEEKPYHLDEINSVVYKADMCLVIGTSSEVRPASTYAYRVQNHGGKVAVFNLNPSEKDARADFVFRGGCEVLLPEIFPELAT